MTYSRRQVGSCFLGQVRKAGHSSEYHECPAKKKVKILLQVIVAKQASFEAYPGEVAGFYHDLQQTTGWFMLLGQVRKAGHSSKNH